mgnify:CR=1 FL=1
MGPKDTLLTTKEFASRSGMTVDQVTRMLREKKLKGHKRSGRWMLPAGQLPAAGSESPKPPPEPAAPEASAAPSPGGRTLSVAEFSAKTYLTESGVIRWLKRGRLQGRQSPGGEWRIDAASLELPYLQHLLRR